VNVSGDLSAREREVAALMLLGNSDADIAAQLFISTRTVGSHVTHIFKKTGVHSRAELAARAAGYDTAAPLEPREVEADTGAVRISVDLSPALYRKLSEYTTATARQIGVVRLAQVEVMRALIEAVDNDLVSGAVRSMLLQSRGRRS
jgi:DNA-binding CsgD family transcriptional regulator